MRTTGGWGVPLPTRSPRPRSGLGRRPRLFGLAEFVLVEQWERWFALFNSSWSLWFGVHTVRARTGSRRCDQPIYSAGGDHGTDTTGAGVPNGAAMHGIWVGFGWDLDLDLGFWWEMGRNPHNIGRIRAPPVWRIKHTKVQRGYQKILSHLFEECRRRTFHQAFILGT